MTETDSLPGVSASAPDISKGGSYVPSMAAVGESIWLRPLMQAAWGHHTPHGPV